MRKKSKGRGIIPKKLVGQSAKIKKGIYSDKYLNKLNKLYPLDEILGSRKVRLADFRLDDLPFDEGSKYVLNCLLGTSAKAGKWQYDIIDAENTEEAKKYLDYVKSHRQEGDKLGLIYLRLDDIGMVEQEGLVQVTTLGNKLIVYPNQKFVEYYISKNESSN